MKKNVVRQKAIRVYPYKQGSASAKKLAETVGGKVLKHVGSKFIPRAGDLVVNWGSSSAPAFGEATTLNPAEAVKVAGCKLKSFVCFNEAGVTTPHYRTIKAEAHLLGFPVVCRTKLNGHSGEGIVIANNADELVDAPLYTKYVKKKDEFRVHVVNNGIIFTQRKARKLDVENPDWQIRNLAGGFAFVEAAEVPEDVAVQALDAIEALGLDFGGVDVLWNDKEGKAYVLEVNCACGLEDRTAERYSEAFCNLLDN